MGHSRRRAISAWLLHHLALASVDDWLAAVLGGVFRRNGFLLLFLHHASLEGLGVVALLAQRKLGWRAGQFQIAVDAVTLT